MTAQHCFHCGEPVPPGFDLQVAIRGEQQPMCCHGCAAVARWITGQQLEQFYQQRAANAARPDARSAQWWQSFNRPAIQDQFTETLPNGDRRMPVLVSNMRCAACSWLLESVLMRLPGVRSVLVNFASGRGELEWDPQQTELASILQRADEIGYPVEPAALALHSRQRSESRAANRRLIVASIGMMQVMMYAVGLYIGAVQDMPLETRDFLRWIALLIATPVVFYSGWPFFAAAVTQLRLRRPGMDVPVALALAIAWCASCINTFTGSGEVYLDSAVMFVFFLGLSRHIEQRTRAQATAMSAVNTSILPLLATRLEHHDQTRLVGVHELQPGDVVVVASGDTIPADGLVLAQANTVVRVDESMLSGESVALDKQPGQTVLAGSVLSSGPLRMQVQAIGRDTVLASIERELEHAAVRQGERFVWLNRLASWFILVVLTLASMTLLFWQQQAGWEIAIRHTLAVLVITCPCALSLAAPTVIAAARARLLDAGMLLLDNDALMQLPQCDHLVVDKTGTLTSGSFSVAAVHTLAGLAQAEVLSLAAALEQHSRHPLASAFQGLPIVSTATQVTEYPGAGLCGRVGERRLCLGSAELLMEQVPSLTSTDFTRLQQAHSHAANDSASDAAIVTEQVHKTLWLADADRLLALIEVADDIKPEAADVLQQLRLPVTMLSGDQAAAVARTAQQLGIDDARAGLLPQQKLSALQQLQQSGHRVLAVGDGINDAPLLAAADVGVAIGAASSLARSKAAVVVLHERLSALLDLRALARRAQRLLRQNLGWAIAYNLCAVPFAMAGLIPPWAAAIGMSLSSLLVVLNSLRLRRLCLPGQRQQTAAASAVSAHSTGQLLTERS
ncbi:MAG: heavy metal translocating P-type ATPase metal-binding domain-containing protein [Wenzhouxiangellaceae bacterium]